MNGRYSNQLLQKIGSIPRLTYRILIHITFSKIEAMKIAHIPHMTWFIEHGDAQ